MVYRSLFRNFNFLKLWGSQLASQIAANLLNFALIIRVYELAQGTRYANIAVSLLILSFGIPSIFFAVFAGAYIDHLDRKKVMVVSNLLRAALVLLFLVGPLEQNLLAVYGLIFIISTISQFFIPAEGAALPVVVKKSDLVSANSLFIFTIYASFLLGYSLAGPIVSFFGSNAAYYITSAAFIFAAALSALLPSLRATAKSHEALLILAHKVAKNLRTNLQKILRSPKLLFPIMQLTIAEAMTNVVIVLAPALSVLLLHRSLSQSAYILMIPAGVGMVVGAVLMGQLFRDSNKARLISIGLFSASLCLILFGLLDRIAPAKLLVPLVALAALGLGFVNALVSISAQTILQLNSTDETRGQIFGALNMMINIAATLPVLLAGITADLVSPTTVLVAAGILIFVYAVFQQKYFKKYHLKTVDTAH